MKHNGIAAALKDLMIFPGDIIGIISLYLPIDSANQLLDKIIHQSEEWRKSARAYQKSIHHPECNPTIIETEALHSVKGILLTLLFQLKKSLQPIIDNADDTELNSNLDEIKNALFYRWGDMPECKGVSTESYPYFNFLDYISVCLSYSRSSAGKSRGPDSEYLEPLLEARNIMLTCASLFSLKTYTINVSLVQLMKKQLGEGAEFQQEIKQDNKLNTELEQKMVFNGVDKGLGHQGIAYRWFSLQGIIAKPRTVCTDLINGKEYQVLLDEEQAAKLKKLCQSAGTQNITPETFIIPDEGLRFGT